MFYHIRKMTQMTMKLLLRNKGFLFFGIALPILATIILNIKNVGHVIVDDKSAVAELSSADDQVAYLNDYELFAVKVYDSSDSPVTINLLEHLAEEGLFQVYRVDVSEMSEDEIMESAKNTAMKDKVGAIVVIDADFNTWMMEQNAGQGVSLYETGDDERYQLLVSSMETILTEYTALSEEGNSEKDLEQKINDYEKNREKVETVAVDVKESGSNLFLNIDYDRTDVLGYTLAILSLAFLFSGIMILGTIIKEKQNLVYTRILLTKAGSGSYLASKFVIILFATLFQTGVTGIAYKLLVHQDIGISTWQFLFLVCMMGLIFNTLSVCIGNCCGSVLSAIYLSFSVWVVTALLGGLYFDITGGSEMMRKAAMLMPQRWILKGAELMIDGKTIAYPMILTVTAAYLIVILVVGILGLKINRKE